VCSWQYVTARRPAEEISVQDASRATLAECDSYFRCGGIFSDIVLLQIFSWFWQWNNSENRLYTVNHKKGGSAFVIINLENLGGF